MRGWAAFLLITLMLATGAASAAITVRCPDPEFSFELPDHFSRLPSSGNIIYLYTSSDQADEIPDTLLNVERLGRTIIPEKAGVPASAPPDTSVMTSNWKGFDLEVLASPTWVAGEPYIARTVQIPLADEAIKISIAMKADQAESLDPFLAGVLRTFEGPTNWSAPLTTGDRIGYVAAGAVGTLLVAGFITFLVMRWRRKRKAVPAAPIAGVYSRLTSTDKGIAALRGGFAAGVSTFILIASGVAIMIGFGPAVITDVPRRANLIAEGAFKFSMFVGLLASTIVAIRQKRQPIPAPPPATQAAHNYNLEHIVDDADDAR